MTKTLYYLENSASDLMAGEKSPECKAWSLDPEMMCYAGCGALQPDHRGRPVRMEFVRLPRATITPSPLAGIWSSALFEDVAEYLPPHVAGPCYLLQDDELQRVKSHITVYCMPQHVVHIYGERPHRYWKCPRCAVRHSRPRGELCYLLDDEIRGRHAVKASMQVGLLIDEWLKARIDWSKFPDIEFVEYPVLDRHPASREVVGKKKQRSR